MRAILARLRLRVNVISARMICHCLRDTRLFSLSTEVSSPLEPSVQPRAQRR